MTIRKTIQAAIQKALGIHQVFQLLRSNARLKGGPERPYAQVEIVFACVERLIQGITGLPLVLSDGEERIVESGPAYDAIFRNPAMNYNRFLAQWIGHWALARDVFIIFPEALGLPDNEYYVVSGLQMQPITHNGGRDGRLIAWQFIGVHGERARFDLREIHQTKNFNPYDKFHGVGPLQSCANSIAYTDAANRYCAATLRNGAEPGVVLTAQGNPTPEERDYYSAVFDARHGGPDNARRTVLLTGGMDIKSVAMKIVEMQVAEISQMKESRIAIAMGVRPELVGLMSEAQYSHGPAQQDFCFNTLVPLASLLAGEITDAILSRAYPSQQRRRAWKDCPGYSCRLAPARKGTYRLARQKAVQQRQAIFAWFDVDQHPTIQEAKRTWTEQVLKFVDSGVPLDQIVDAYDLPFDTDAMPWAKEWWISMGQVPARYILENGLEAATGPSQPEGQDEEQPPAEEQTEADDDESKSLDRISSLIVRAAAPATPRENPQAAEVKAAQIWRRWAASWQKIEREYIASLRSFFGRQQRILIARLREAMPAGKAATKGAEEIVARIVFDLAVEDRKIKVINQTFFERAGRLGVEQVLRETGTPAGDMEEQAARIQKSPAMREHLEQSSRNIVEVNRTTRRRVADTLREGLGKEESLDDLAQRIQVILGESRARSQRIARTQTAGAVSSGRQESMQAVGVELKAWITSGDDQVRDAHRAAGSRYREGIPVDQPFEVGGEFLKYPGDPAGSPGNIINCRCMHVARRAKGKQFDLDHYLTIYGA